MSTGTDSNLQRALSAGRFAVTAEALPPLSGEAAPFIAECKALTGLADAINVTDGASAQVRMAALAAAALLVQAGLEPILQLTCRDRNRLALQADLIGGWALGIRNILCLKGDDPTAGDQPNTKPVFDLETRDLLATAARMRDDGRLPKPSDREIESPPRFFIGAADMPIDPAPDWKPDALQAKSDGGANFVQTQFCFDAGIVERYATRLRDEGITERLFVLVGLGPIPSARSARWMREHLYGVQISDALIERLEKAADPTAEGRRICIELIQQMCEIDGIAGVHLMAPHGRKEIPAIIEDSGVRAGR